MTRIKAQQYLDKTYCLSDGDIYHEYLLLGALSGLTLSKNAVNRTGNILYTRNGVVMSGRGDMIFNSKDFEVLNILDLDDIRRLLEAPLDTP